MDKFVTLLDRMELCKAASTVSEFAYAQSSSYISVEESKKLEELCDKVVEGISKEMNEIMNF